MENKNKIIILNTFYQADKNFSIKKIMTIKLITIYMLKSFLYLIKFIFILKHTKGIRHYLLTVLFNIKIIIFKFSLF